MEEHERIRISGVINDVTFANPENGFTVLELESGDELITAVGVMPELKAGELLELSGYWDFHASFGRQFRVELCEHKMPASAGDILRYLAAGGVKGIGSKLAVKIVDKFGENTLDIIENDPERLAQIRGISPEKAKQISADFKRQFAVREIMISLEKYGMTTAECVKAFNAFGVRAADIIKRNPYALCGEGVGFSFERAEFIADQLPDPPDNGYRLQAGVLHVMSHNLSNGHTCIPREKMFAPCAELLSTNEDTVDITIDELIGSGRLVSEFIDNREFLFLPNIYKAEKSSAERMKQILRFPPAGRKAADREIDRIEKKNGIKYGDLQRKAIVTAIERGLLILTGGPGTGKTTTLNGILQLFEDDGLKVALAAPTGRAAKRSVHALKFDGCVQNAVGLARFMSDSVKKNFSGVKFDFVCCVPLSESSLKKRGYNQSALLAKEIAKELGVPFEEKLLSRPFQGKEQKTLGGIERFGGVIGAFDCAENKIIESAAVLLCDDISTTGATLNECAKLLLLCGADKVYCVSAAITKKEDGKCSEQTSE